MTIPLFLVDRVGHTYPRKNQYLKDLALAQQSGNKEKEKQIRNNKKEHPYHQKLKTFRTKEKAFLSQLHSKISHASHEQDRTLRQWKARLRAAEEKSVFYQPYVDLTYDAQLAFLTAEKEKELLPRMIQEYAEAKSDLAYAEEKKKSLTQEEESQYQDENAALKKVAQEKEHERRFALQTAYQEGNISRKAMENGKKEALRKKKQELDAINARAPHRYQRELTRNIQHQIHQIKTTQEDLLSEELSAIRRATPLEVEHGQVFAPILSFFFPGSGQILNGQRKKGLWLLLAVLFIYGIAIPYALGFGNYQGNGIAGLITLGQGGRRVDRSIIFLIEGILAIVLLMLSVVLMLLAAKDAKQVSTEKQKGIRENNWFETRRSISENGFPYFVNIPAVLLILFITLIPIFTAVLLSFTGMDPDHQSKFGWVGLSNYMTLFQAQGLEGSLFWRILVWTLLWTVSATTLAIAVGMGLAILVNSRHIRGKRFFRTVYILPWAVPAFITIMFFSILLSSSGYLTELISSIAGHVVNVKDSQTLTRIALILIQTWCGNAYVFLLATGVLQSIPEDLYEAADIDGASGWQRLVYITLPMLLFQTAPILIGQYTFNFNNYTIIDLFNGGGPFNPSVYGRLAGGSDLLISYIFKLTMDNQYQALGAAIAILISLVLMGIAFIGYRQTAAFKEE